MTYFANRRAAWLAAAALGVGALTFGAAGAAHAQAYINVQIGTPPPPPRYEVVPAPRPGDRIEIDGDAFLIQGEPVRDRERLVWTVDLRPA